MNNDRIRAGICLFGLTGLTPDLACQVAAIAGIRPVSFGLKAIRQDMESWEAFMRSPERTGEVMKERLGRYGQQAVELFMCAIPWEDGVTPSEADTSKSAPALDCFRRICAYAAAAGFSHVMGVPGTPGEDAIASWACAEEALAKMTTIAREEGTGFTVEPHRGSLLSHPDDALRMARNVPGLAYSLDYSHFYAQGFAIDAVQPLHAYSLHMHIKQASPGVPKSKWHEGTVPYADVIGRLWGAAWSGVLSSEFIGPLRYAATDVSANSLIQNLETIRHIETAIQMARERSGDVSARLATGATKPARVEKSP